MKPHWRIRPAQVKLLNVALRELRLDREDFKARFGVDSTKHLTNAQFDQAMQYFEACGFVYRPRVKQSPVVQGAQRVKKVYLAAIEKLLNDLGRDWAYAEGVARQMFSGVKKLQWLGPEELHKVQIGLIYEARKQAGNPVTRKPETLEKRRVNSTINSCAVESHESLPQM